MLIPNSASKTSLNAYFCQKKKKEIAYNEFALSSPNMRMKEFSERKTIIFFGSKYIEARRDLPGSI